MRDKDNDPSIASADRMQAAVARKGELATVGLAPESSMHRQLRNEQLYILPFGFLLAAVAISLLVWLTRSRLSLLGEMAQALKNREFIVHYQPLVRLKDGACVGAEALIRWPRPDGTMMRPDYFIPQAEESGLIEPITDQLVETVVREMRALLLAEPQLHIAINVCASDIQTGRLLGVLARALDGSGIGAGQIWLEATERGFIDVAAARDALERARAMGFSVAIDDFGTGYSSLAYLQNLPVDALKIDKSFIDTIGGETVTSSVTSHIIAMAQTLKLAIIAEGVETQLQADYLRARDVEYGQGWLFSKALPPAQFIAYCRQHPVAQAGASRAAA
nr:EAL domain-containing protein [uncultured Janthinobacterium sp.]